MLNVGGRLLDFVEQSKRGGGRFSKCVDMNEMALFTSKNLDFCNLSTLT